MGLLDQIAGRLGYSRVSAPEFQRKPKTIAPYARAVRFGVFPGNPKRGTRILRHFAENSEFVRTAINRRKHAIGQAEWQIVRTDDKNAQPNPALVDQVTELFRFCNTKMESFRSLLDQVIEDLLVLDAGCIEKERAVGGKIVGLWAVDGATIVVDPSWDGSQPNIPRYTQWDNFVKICDLQNDELVYMMHNPRTYSAIGFSPVEALVRVVEAELYGEEYDFTQLKGAPPGGILDLGAGVDPAQVEAFREYWAQEISGSATVAIVGGGAPLDATSNAPAAKWTSFQTDSRASERMAYKTWLAKKIAAVFEMDPMNFNIHEGVNRSTSNTMQSKTDEGLVGLASIIAEYVTREIVWELDPSHKHGFRFDGLTERDEAAQANIDQIRMNIGVTTPNEIRARDGMQPVEWGDEPWAHAQVAAQDEESVEGEEDDTDDAGADKEPAPGEGKPNQKKPAKTHKHFEVRHLRTSESLIRKAASPNKRAELTLARQLRGIIRDEKKRLTGVWDERKERCRQTLGTGSAASHDFEHALEGLGEEVINAQAYIEAAKRGLVAGHGSEDKAGDIGRARASRAVNYARGIEVRISAKLARVVREYQDGQKALKAKPQPAVTPNQALLDMKREFDDALEGMTSAVTRYSEVPWSAGQQGYSDALEDNGVLMDWVMDDDAQHCDDCPDIEAGSPYNADSLPTWPGSGDTECLDHCRCTIQAETTSWNDFIGAK